MTAKAHRWTLHTWNKQVGDSTDLPLGAQDAHRLGFQTSKSRCRGRLGGRRKEWEGLARDELKQLPKKKRESITGQQKVRNWPKDWKTGEEPGTKG